METLLFLFMKTTYSSSYSVLELPCVPCISLLQRSVSLFLKFPMLVPMSSKMWCMCSDFPPHSPFVTAAIYGNCCTVIYLCQTCTALTWFSMLTFYFMDCYTRLIPVHRTFLALFKFAFDSHAHALTSSVKI